MKDHFRFATMLLCICTLMTAAAQDRPDAKKEKPSSFGLFAGLNTGKAAFEPELYESSSNLGYEIGFFIRSGKWAYFQSGLTYMKLSQKLTSGSSFPVSATDNLNVGRLEIPAFFGINLLPIGKNIFNIRAFAGPTFSYAAGVSENELGIEAADLNRLQADLGAGLGLDVLFMKLDLGFNYGLANLIKDQQSHMGYGYLTFGLGF